MTYDGPQPPPETPQEPAEPARPELVLPSDSPGTGFGEEEEASRAPLIAGLVTGVIVIALLGWYIFSNRPDDAVPVAGSTTTTSAASATTTTESPTSSSTTGAVSGDLPRLESSSCQFTLATDIDYECGWVTVPEDHEHPDNGREVRIAVALFRSPNPDAPADPILYLDGGPGGHTLEPLPFTFTQLWRPILDNRDLILFDQRGVGYSTPSLDCPEELEMSFSILDEDLTPEEERSHELDAIQACHDRLVAEGIDLARYNSAENAADVADLLQVLDIDEVNLLGISYGTRLAETIMRDHPERVRSVILDSTYTPDVDLVSQGPANFARAMAKLWEGCAADADCAARYPNLDERLFRLVDEYEASPVTAPVQDFLNGGEWQVMFDGEWLLGTVFQGLYSDEVIPLLPEMIEELENGDTSTLSLLTSNTLANANFLSLGMMLSVQCNEEVAFTSQAAVDAGLEGFDDIALVFDGSSNLGEFMFAACDVWQAGSASPVENEPVESSLPTLVMAGEYDPITPPAWGAGAADHLSNATFVEFPARGHGTSITAGCPQQIALAFFDDPTGTVDTSCVAAMAPVDFVIPGEPAPPVQLVEFTESILGNQVSSVVPEGWTSLGFGAYARGDSAIDQTAILFQVVPFVGPDEFVDLLAGQLGIDGSPERGGTVDSEVGTWQLYSASASGLNLDIAAIDLGTSTAAVVAVSNPGERETMVNEVLLPAVAAFRLES